MKHNSLIRILNLLSVKGLGPQRVRFIISHFGLNAEYFSLSSEELCKAPGVDLKTARAIHQFSDQNYGEKEIDRMNKVGACIISFWDKEYPKLLKKIYDPPVLLYVKGMPLEKEMDCIGVVGTRNITPYGKKITLSIVSSMVSSGLIIVSGLARGVDSVAHRKTVSAGGKTLSVLGNGIDFVYPSENTKLAEMIMEKGSIISEFPIGTQPDAGNFPQRNRIISGLSHGTIVIEAGNRSGAILTALNAVDQNREVFAVPGRLTDKMSVGCNRLIRNGAIPVESGDQILDHIKNQLFSPIESIQQNIKLHLTKEEHALIDLLEDDPLYIDDIVSKGDMEITQALTLLLKLELKGAVVQLSGKQFARA
ncbi:MAG: DNA-protecting protein DprA [Candidatus Marinimicrobia bacterium]|nr:DNA-protecting protein DprA [Candidatus Neomarinimicrobiota bacterium]MBL7010026.1 DNA-protecting protein DprA [Candidatus Neomarinimicrobiota bacterium]MBL7030295.1 DNA-protecting protein DprA [Candidatus Neomarinimicrobiota bacterium]